MLTLDDPTPTACDDPPPAGLVATMADDAWLLDLFHTVRGHFERRGATRHDPDRLYRTHGEPRD